MAKKILITGATSFLGRRFCKLFRNEEFVMVPISHLQNTSLSTIPLDLTNKTEIHKVIQTVSPDIIIHAAALVDLSRDFSVGQKCIDVNTMGTMNLLEEIRSKKPSLFIYISSEEIYGNGPIPFSEDQRADPPSPYAISKIAAEYMCQWYGNEYSFPTVSVRFGTFYGPEQPNTKYFAQTILHALKNEPIPVNSGKKKRDYIYIDDAIDLLQKIITNPRQIPLVNGAGGVSYELLEVIHRIIALTNSSSQVQIGAIPDRITERHEWCADISKAKEIYGWVPKTSLEEGLKKTIAYFKNS